jgi:peptidoglycan-associated lipoprotein
MLANIAKGLLIGGVVVGMVGCSSTGKKSHSSGTYDKTRVASVTDAVEFYGEELTAEQEKELLNTNTVHFAYDSDNLTPRSKKVILAHARKLLENPTLKMRVDGHTDERGSREYNIGLGERRANAVAKLCEEKGLTRDRLATVSYGKEKPVSIGNDEGSWSKNRRAEMEFEGRVEG